METSTHNSGVIHAGIYYPPGSLKAKLCVEGRDRLYAFCAAHDIPHRRYGKLIVAAEAAEVAALEHLLAIGLANGVSDLEMVDAAFVRRKEPHVAAVAALNSPSTGVLSAEAVVQTLRRLCAERDVAYLPGTPVTRGVAANGAFSLSTGREEI